MRNAKYTTTTGVQGAKGEKDTTVYTYTHLHYHKDRVVIVGVVAWGNVCGKEKAIQQGKLPPCMKGMHVSNNQGTHTHTLNKW